MGNLIAMPGKRTFQIVLETPEGPRSIPCAEDENIWDAAARHDIALPATCHQGRCLSCAATLLSGRVEHDHPDAYFDADRAAGYILLCRAQPRSDVRILTHQADQMRAHRIASGLPAPYG
jgi:ferredoxin